MTKTKVRTMTVGLLGALALGTVGVPVVQAGTTSCQVRNVTQATVGRTFRVMVDAAVDGDRLTVRGICLARRVDIRTDITIKGIGDSRPVLDARDEGRVLLIGGSATVTLRHLVITGGDTAGNGSGIANDGTLTLTDSVVRGNTARRFGIGGGIDNDGTLTLTDSVVRDNTSDNVGGGIDNEGTLTLTRSAVRGNMALWQGGGVENDGTLTLTHSVVRSNTAKWGGGIENWGNLTLDGSSVTANTAKRAGGGIWNGTDSAIGVGTVTLLPR